MEQRTLAQSFTLSGVGIHSGAVGSVTVHPAEPNFGRKFRVGGVLIPAQAEYVVDTTRCTTLSHDGARISTAEHLLSALHGLHIDNALIEADCPEIPILDGSALPFVSAILAAGVVGQETPPKTLVLQDDLVVEEGKSRMRATMSHQPGLSLHVETVFEDWAEGHSVLNFQLDRQARGLYCTDIAPARTFAFQREVEMLIAAGLAKGGSLDNALIIAPPDTFSSPLRVPQEWGVHKILDILGDLALVDARLKMSVIATRPGHRINVRLAQTLRRQLEKGNS